MQKPLGQYMFFKVPIAHLLEDVGVTGFVVMKALLQWGQMISFIQALVF